MAGFQRDSPQSWEITCFSTSGLSNLITLRLEASSLDIDFIEDEPSYLVNVNGTALYKLSPNTRTFRKIAITFS